MIKECFGRIFQPSNGGGVRLCCARYLLLAVMSCGLAAGSLLLFAPPLAAKDKPFKVVTTFTIIADMARNVAGSRAVVHSITKPGAEIHNYQPTPRDILKAQDANLILWNGLGLELWFEKFFQNLKNVPSAVISENVEPISIGEGPYKGKANPHAWMSPRSAQIYIDNIAAAMAKYDPDHAAYYQKNATQYKEKIKAMLAPLQKQLASVEASKRWLVSSEGAFSYLARDLGLKELYLWPINADAQGTPQQVRKVIDKMRAHKISVIFSESTISPRPAQQVAREVGAHYGGILYVDSLSAANGPVPTYVDLLRVTTQTIAKGLAR